jgi:hypothetical protein
MQKLIRMLIMATIAFWLLAGLAAGEVKLVKGQTLYVPSQTSVMSGSHSFDAKPTIFIHNTDQNSSINIVRVDFYNTSGTLVEKYLQKPLKLNANAVTRINIKERLSGEEGSGAHFIVQWQADHRVVEPLVEVWFIGAVGSRGHSFVSHPRIIQEDTN